MARPPRIITREAKERGLVPLSGPAISRLIREFHRLYCRPCVCDYRDNLLESRLTPTEVDCRAGQNDSIPALRIQQSSKTPAFRRNGARRTNQRAVGFFFFMPASPQCVDPRFTPWTVNSRKCNWGRTRFSSSSSQGSRAVT